MMMRAEMTPPRPNLLGMELKGWRSQVLPAREASSSCRKSAVSARYCAASARISATAERSSMHLDLQFPNAAALDSGPDRTEELKPNPGSSHDPLPPRKDYPGN